MGSEMCIRDSTESSSVLVCDHNQTQRAVEVVARSGDLSQAPIKGASDRTARGPARPAWYRLLLLLGGRAVVLQSAEGEHALRMYVLLLLTVACRLWAVLCSYDTIAHSKR